MMRRMNNANERDEDNDTIDPATSKANILQS